MAENYTKDIKESVYHGAVISALAVGYTMPLQKQDIHNVCIILYIMYTLLYT